MVTTGGLTGEPLSRSYPGEQVLVVDDDPRIRRVLRWALEEDGLEADDVGDGRAALGYLARKRPSLVLLDIGLPLVDGVGVAEGVRDAYGPTLPIVVITAEGHAAEQAQRLGAVAYFHKPFDIEALLSAVRVALAYR